MDLKSLMNQSLNSIISLLGFLLKELISSNKPSGVESP